jgi:hypothetical protein
MDVIILILFPLLYLLHTKLAFVALIVAIVMLYQGRTR